MNKSLRITGVAKAFGGIVALNGIDFILRRRDRLAIAGPSGSGKTTLLRLIAGLEVPSNGEIAIAGNVVSKRDRLLVPPERRGVAMVFQGLALLPHLRALDQVRFAARGPEAHTRAAALLDAVGLGHRAGARLDELSGGERQRIALARALVQEPELLLMDEPFASLDDDRRAEMRNLLRDLLDRLGTTLVLVTHAAQDVYALAEHVIVLERGRPVAAGDISSVIASPKYEVTVKALGLGQVVVGSTIDGRTAVTPFGEVAIVSTQARGMVRLLVRPGQAVVAELGNDVIARSIEPRPPGGDGQLRHTIHVEAAGARLAIATHGPIQLPRVGQTVRVQITGECALLDGGA